MAVKWDGAHQRRLRRAGGWSLEHLAIAAGRSAATITSYELGRCTPPLATAHTIARALGVEVAELLTDGEPGRERERVVVSDGA